MGDKRVSVFYGRARRIELLDKILLVAISVLVIVLVGFLVFKQSSGKIPNVNFSYMKRYFYDRGYTCDLIQKSGGKCRKDNENITYVFTRNDDGFGYLVRTSSFVLTMNHSLKAKSYITFKTSSDAFSGYRNKEYVCELKRDRNNKEMTVLDEIGDCVTEDKEVLNLNSYIGVIESAQREVERIIKASGYNRTELLENYRWVL